MPTRLKQQAVGEQIRRLRLERDLTLRKLAKQTGFSPSFLSQLENGQVSPSISSMEKIAEALGTTIVDFFVAASEADGGLVVRASDRQALSSGWSNAAVEAVSPAASAARLEAMLVTLRPRGRSGKHPYPHTREELVFVLSGSVTLTLGPDESRLEAGDAACILPGELRLWRNDGASPARILIVTSPLGAAGVRRSRPSMVARRAQPRQQKRPR